MYLIEGSPVTGWQKVGGRWYFFADEDGKYPVNDPEGGEVIFYPEGAMVSGCSLTIDGMQYFFSSDGSLRNGWIKIDWMWAYLEEGQPVTGWKRIDSQWYFFCDRESTYFMNSDPETGEPVYYPVGAMYNESAEWGEIDGNVYHFRASGALVTGWDSATVPETGKKVWWYMGSDGAMRTGWQRIDGNWYYFYADPEDTRQYYGSMATGGTFIDTAYYYFGPRDGNDGYMRTGWIKFGDSWEYYRPDGTQVVDDWARIDGEWYLFTPEGCMVTGEYGGNLFSEDGVWLGEINSNT